MSDRELMQQWLQPGAIVPVDVNTVRILIDALRERLAQPEPQAPRPDYRDWDYQNQLDEQEKLAQSPLDRMAENARELGLDYEPVQEPVAHSIVAGALFDFMGWLTTRRERLVLSSSDDAAPAADAIKDFAQMRSLSINDAQVQEWQKHLATPPRREWVGLTLEEFDEIHDRSDTMHEAMVDVVKKLREKNA